MELMLFIPVILGVMIAVFAVVFVVKVASHNTRSAYRQGRRGHSRSRGGDVWVGGSSAHPHDYSSSNDSSWSDSGSSSNDSGGGWGGWGGDSGSSGGWGGDSGSSGGGDSGGGGGGGGGD